MTHTLLLADDSVTIQRVIELTFADEDIRVVAVSDGDEAIERLDADPPDIVLADVGMPGKSGYDVAEYIKQTPRLAHIPVVLLTGAFEPIDQAKAARAGCDGVLAKPFEPQLVIGRVKELLARSRQATFHDLDAALSPDPPSAMEWSPADELPRTTTDKRAPSPGHLDDYFDRLDAAFANLSSDSQRDTSEAARPTLDAGLDWFDNNPPASRSPDLPLAPPPPSPPPALGPVPTAQTAASPPAPPARPAPAPAAPSNTPSGPAASSPLADAFALLLAAEQGQGLPGAGLNWPVPAPAASVDTDALVHRVAVRVLGQLSDRVVRETVADIVSKVAERLVRAEIERIKSAAK